MNYLIIQYLFTTGEKYNTFLLQVASQKGIQHAYFLLQLANYVVLFQSGRGAYENKRRKHIKNMPHWLTLKFTPHTKKLEKENINNGMALQQISHTDTHVPQKRTSQKSEIELY